MHIRVLLDAQVCGAAWASVWFKVSQVVPVGSGWAFIIAWAHQLPQEGLGWVDIWSRGQYSGIPESLQLVRCRGVLPGESSITFRTGATIRILIVGVVCSSLRKFLFGHSAGMS